MALDIKTKSFAPEMIIAEVMRTLENDLVAMKIAKNYSSEVSSQGESIVFPGLADPTISSYTGSISSYEDLLSSEINLLVNQANMYNFKVKDIEAQIANQDLMNSQIRRAAYGLKNACDTYVLRYASDDAAATAVTDTSCDTATILGDIAMASQSLDEANVAAGNKFIVVPPWVKTKLMLAGVVFQINNGMKGYKGGVEWAKYNDMDIYVSNNVYESSATPVSVCMAGSYDAIAFAQNITQSETLRAESSFDDLCRGLHVFGMKVVKPQELCAVTLTYAAETAI